MSDAPAFASTVPLTPGEQADAAAEQQAEAVQVPSEQAPSTEASSAKVADTGQDPAVREGHDADALVATADAEAAMPQPPPRRIDAPPPTGAPHGSTPPAAASPAANGATTSPAAASLGEVEIECPGCALVVVGDSPRPSAEWFCPRCDYPLFWASPPAEPAARSDRARHRLPGSGGRKVVGAEPCWYCGELNEPGVSACFRCAATLPKPAAPVQTVAAPPEPVPVPYPVPFPSVTWPYVGAALLGGTSAGIALTLWLVGGG